METSPKIDHHKPDIKEAIYYLPPNMDEEIVFRALKYIYPQEGYDLAVKWMLKTKKFLPDDFDEFWENLKLTLYQEQNLDPYLREHIYNLAEKTGWTPKALRKGTQTKKPPSKQKQKELAERLQSSKTLEENLTLAREEHLSLKDQSFIAAGIVNFKGGCFKHPFFGKDEIPRSIGEFARKLTKIVDCEVWILEATEYIEEKQGREPDELEVRYRVKLTNRKDKDVIAVITYEEMTTKTRFSNFLVRKGFVKFLNKTWSVLQDNRATAAQRNTFSSIQANLENSNYFLEKSVQVPLTKSIDTLEESNLRCCLLNVRELKNSGLVDELLEKAQEYERDRIYRKV